MDFFCSHEFFILEPVEYAQRCDISPCHEVESFREVFLYIFKVFRLLGCQVQARCCPEELVVGAVVAVCSGCDVRVVCRIEFPLVVECVRMCLGPCVCNLRLVEPYLAYIVCVYVIAYPCHAVQSGHRAQSSCKIQRCGNGFLYHITLLTALCRSYKSLEIWRGEFMVDSSIFRILHGPHPLLIVQKLLEQRVVYILGITTVFKIVFQVIPIGNVREHEECLCHQTHRIAGINHILVIISGIIPSFW